MIAVIDYGMGNLRSVEKALQKSAATSIKITSSERDINNADKIVMPGVGAIAEAMQALEDLKLVQAIKRNIFKKPYLGICLGLQLLFQESEEGHRTKGLGILKGKVRRFANNLKVPHIGWNNVKIKNPCLAGRQEKSKIKVMENIPDNSYFYFCHSYYVVPKDKKIIAATTDYDLEFTSLICKDNLYAMQFHPEKSQKLGLKILENFVNL